MRSLHRHLRRAQVLPSEIVNSRGQLSAKGVLTDRIGGVYLRTNAQLGLPWAGMFMVDFPV